MIRPSSNDLFVAGPYEEEIPCPNAVAALSYGGVAVAGFFRDLRTLLHSACLPGSTNFQPAPPAGETVPPALTLSPVGDQLYVVGFTLSSSFPQVTGGAQDSFEGGYENGFVASLALDLGSVQQATFLGGIGGPTVVTGLAIHPQTGEIYVAGTTASPFLPAIQGGADVGFAGAQGTVHGFVTRLAP